MGMEKELLLERMSIVASIKKGKKKNANCEFYGNYAVFVFKSLKNPIVLRFLHWILKRETIPKDRIKNVQIRMFPSLKKNGRYLNGKCNSPGEVFLYPKRLDACRKKSQRLSLKCVREYIRGRALASLIHELLHLKYGCNEKKVKALTKQYYSMFNRKHDFKPLDFEKHQELVFNY